MRSTCDHSRMWLSPFFPAGVSIQAQPGPVRAHVFSPLASTLAVAKAVRTKQSRGHPGCFLLVAPPSVAGSCSPVLPPLHMLCCGGPWRRLLGCLPGSSALHNRRRLMCALFRTTGRSSPGGVPGGKAHQGAPRRTHSWTGSSGGRSNWGPHPEMFFYNKSPLPVLLPPHHFVLSHKGDPPLTRPPFLTFGCWLPHCTISLNEYQM